VQSLFHPFSASASREEQHRNVFAEASSEWRRLRPFRGMARVSKDIAVDIALVR
jgi:hypothetical protein